MKDEDKKREQLIDGFLAPETRPKQQVEGFAGARREWDNTFNLIPDPIAIVDRGHRIVWLNKTMADRLDIPRDEALGLTCFKVVHGMEQPPPFCPHSKLMADGKAHVVEVHEERLGGDFIVSVSPLQDEEGRLIGSIHLARDITKRRRVEELLRRSEEEYRTLFENLYDVLFRTDLDGKILKLSPSVEQHTGYKAEELIGTNMADYYANPQDREKLVRRLKQQGSLENYEVKMRKKDGSIAWAMVSAKPHKDEEGNILGMEGIARNVTELKRAEEALKQAHNDLEKRVKERTAELVQLSETLRLEIEERKQIERELRKREADLAIHSNELEEVNTALRVLLKRRDQDKTELEEKVLSNVKELVAPYVERLKNSKLSPDEMAYVHILESNLNDIVSPFLQKLTSNYLSLTPTEIRIANLVKEGRTSKEIAELLNLSDRTVEFHRQNIRRKLGIVNKTANLRSHLLSFQ